MFSHLTLGINDFEQAFFFYGAVLAPLNLKLRFCDHTVPWAGWQPPEGDRPLFIITRPVNQQLATSGNGQMTAFLAPSRQVVDKVYQMAISLGAQCEGKPDLRPGYHPHYYGAYFRDPEGNKLHVCCHESEELPQ